VNDFKVYLMDGRSITTMDEEFQIPKDTNGAGRTITIPVVEAIGRRLHEFY
jgi:hypothetical protein